jgi:hypothetical protein
MPQFQNVPTAKYALFDPLSVDENPVEAPQILDDVFTTDQTDQSVPLRNGAVGEPDVVFRVSADRHHGLERDEPLPEDCIFDGEVIPGRRTSLYRAPWG